MAAQQTLAFKQRAVGFGVKKSRRSLCRFNKTNYELHDSLKKQQYNSGYTKSPIWLPLRSFINETAVIGPDSIALINTVTNAGLKFDEKEGKMRVCRAIAEIREESERKGFDEGIRQNINSLKRTLGCTTEQAMDALEIPAEERSKYLNQSS